MGEPRLEDIGDYNTLKGEKRRAVIAVILSGLIIGIIYVVAYNIYDTPKDKIEVKETIKNIPLR